MALKSRLPLPPTVPTDIRILDIAAEHIRRYGVERTTITGIAAEAIMSHANIYRYYPSKSALFDEITASWLKQLEAGLRAIADAPDPAFDKLERILFAVHRAYRDKLESDPAIFALFADAAAAGNAVVRKHRSRVELEIQRTLEEGTSGDLFEINEQKQAIAFVFDSMHRFIHPVSVRLDAEVPRAVLEGRAARISGLVLRALASGRF
jgi:AcrR family transcriptional regulator